MIGDLAGNPVSPEAFQFVGAPLLEGTAGAGFSDEVLLEFRSAPALRGVLGGFSDEISVELLAVSVEREAGDAGGFSDEVSLEFRSTPPLRGALGGFSDEISVELLMIGKELEAADAGGFSDEIEWSVHAAAEERAASAAAFSDALRLLQCDPTADNRFEEAVGVLNGSNVLFSTQVNYVPGTLRVFLNGRLVTKRLDDGFTEEWPPEFVMKTAPRSTDSLFVFYEECSAS